jgi:hypothetical protein
LRSTARDQVSLALLAVGQAGRGALARMRRSRLLRWRYRSEAADELLLAPPNGLSGERTRAYEAAIAEHLLPGAG